MLDEQEFLRLGAPDGGFYDRHENQTVDSVVDSRTIHETYMWPFAEAARAGVSAFMGSYNHGRPMESHC
jgi:beta-glucosidase